MARRLGTRAWGLILVAVVLGGCMQESDKKRPAGPTCTKFGQQCEVAPGKLGSCVLRDNCVGKGCFVCQPQH